MSDQLNRIAAIMHYPECWDTMAYPTLADAVSEVSRCTSPDCTHNQAFDLLVDSYTKAGWKVEHHFRGEYVLLTDPAMRKARVYENGTVLISNNISGEYMKTDSDYFVCDWCDDVIEGKEGHHAYEHCFCRVECANEYIQAYGKQPDEM